MSSDKIKFGKKAIGFLTSGSTKNEGHRDQSGVRAIVEKQVSVEEKPYKVYPWGTNNMMPVEKLKLLRSNGDAMNLINARVDFLYGGGFGFFEHQIEGANVIKKPYMSDKIFALQAKGVDFQLLAIEMLTSICETANIICYVKNEDGTPILSNRDVLTWRAELAENGEVKRGILAPDWSDDQSISRNGVAVPYYNDGNEGLIHAKMPQSGQFYYGFPQWWADESCDWLETMNIIANRLKSAVGSNNNVSHIVGIASSYFDQMVAAKQDSEDVDENFDFEREKDKARSEFYKNTEKFLLTGEVKVLFDECDFDAKGELSPMIKFNEVKRSLNSKEYIEAYNAALRGFANASGILSGLAGVSDGKTLGGSGSELKVSANYQQFFRTYRERVLVAGVINRVYRKYLELPDNVSAGFFSVQLVNDNMDKSGVQTANSETDNNTTA